MAKVVLGTRSWNPPIGVAGDLMQAVGDGAWVAVSDYHNSKRIASVDEIQPALTAEKNLEIIQGDFYVDATLDMGAHLGGIMRGAGRGQIQPTTGQFRGSETNLIAGSALGTDPILEFRGSDRTMSELCVWGTDYDGKLAGDPKHEMGLLVKYQEGPGTGKMNFENCCFGWLKTAVKFGDTQDDMNCDLCHFMNCRTLDCDVCFLSLSNFVIALQFTNTIVNGEITDFLRVEGGGKHTIDKININSHDMNILHIVSTTNGGNPTIGTGNNWYTIKDVVIDAQGDDCRILKMTPQSGGQDPPINVSCLGGHISNATYTGPAWDIFQNTFLTIRDYAYIQNNHIRWTQNPSANVEDSTVIVDGCRLTGGVAAEIFDVTGSSGVCNAVVKNCVNATGGIIADYTATLTGGP